jgi:hypothetical protein
LCHEFHKKRNSLNNKIWGYFKENGRKVYGFHEWFKWHVSIVFNHKEFLRELARFHVSKKKYLHSYGNSRRKMGYYG